MKILIQLLIIGIISRISAFSTRQKFDDKNFKLQPGADYGEPLFLTPYIQQGHIAEGKAASLVGPLNGTQRQSYSGFFTVDPIYNSNMFFWYFPAELDPETAPVVVWLQGGPGGTSIFGLFNEIGPFVIDKDLDLHERGINWAIPFNLIFFDNPVGAGFSFTENDAGYAKNQTDVANNLYEALLQFFTLYPELQPLDFYVTGESYAGKYIPAISYKIMQENPSATLKINLKGFAIGDGWIDPVKQLNYGDYLFNIGLINEQQRSVFYEKQAKMAENINKGNWRSAENNSNEINHLYYSYSKLNDQFNYLRNDEPADQKYYNNYINKPEVRKAVHVGNLTFNDGNECYKHLVVDICKSTKPWLEALLDYNYKVLLYNGQLDFICAYYLTINMIDSLHWKGAADYRNAKRHIWRVDPGDKQIAGYVKNVNNFWEILVRNAGHILPYDQPLVAFDMITRFVFNKSFSV
ncbi:hypothetical protein CHUAL_003662 [Chamberlinius hualienensis]